MATAADAAPWRPQLVYLDTWTASLLARTLRADPDRFGAFLDVWGGTASRLALSRAHLLELRRHRDPEVRATRYALIEALLPAPFDMLLGAEHSPLAELTDREIAVAAMRHLGRPLPPQADAGWVGFPMQIATAADVAVIREQLESDLLGGVADLFRSALEMRASLDARPAGTAYDRPRLAGLPDAPPDPTTLAALDRAAAEATSLSGAHPLVREAQALLGAADLEDSLAVAREQVDALLARVREIGAVGALREGDAQGQSRRNEFVDVHLQNRAFSASVRRVATALSGVQDARAIDGALRGVRRAACPGLWLRDAVEIELRKAKAMPEANDWFDLDHLTHLPYVDVYFADREMAAAVRQVLGRKERLPPALRRVAAPVTGAATLDAIEAALRAVTR